MKYQKSKGGNMRYCDLRGMVFKDLGNALKKLSKEKEEKLMSLFTKSANVNNELLEEFVEAVQPCLRETIRKELEKSRPDDVTAIFFEAAVILFEGIK